ncbi:MAG: nucleotide sugar dehydrogenase [bacterium]
MNSAAMELKDKILSKKARIGIIGLGYVGLPLVIRFGEVGYTVTGFDVDEKKVGHLNAGESYIKHISADKIDLLVNAKKFMATTDFAELEKMDCIIICVPTPLNDKKEPDLSYVENTADQIAKFARLGQLISLESTTYPGTTRDVLLPKFQDKGLKVGEDFCLVYSPEREDPGNPKFNTQNIPKVLGGITSTCTELGQALYEQVVNKVVVVSSPEAAEFTKILENTFRAVNIALVNELKILGHKMGVDIWEIIEAASTKPFGFMPFYPGPGLGGHCIPIDPFYLSWKAKEYNFNTRFIELAGEVNTNMPGYVVSRIMEAMNDRKLCLNGSKILILGVAYKKDVDDMRESPALGIIDLLKERDAQVFYNDPFIPEIPKLRKYDLQLKSLPLTEDMLNGMEAVVVITDHSQYDYKWIFDHSKLFIDTRNVLKKNANGRHVKA